MSDMIDIWALLDDGSAQRIPVDASKIIGIFGSEQGNCTVLIQGEEPLQVDRMQAQLIDERWRMWKRGQKAMSPL
jgi:hypothetical protein